MRFVTPSNVLYLAALASLPAPACHPVTTATTVRYVEQGHYEKAIEVGKQVVAGDPWDAEASFEVGVAYSRLDSVAAAYVYLSRVVESARESSGLSAAAERLIADNFERHFAIGADAYRNGSYAGAVRELEKSTTADPRRAVGFYYLGKTYLQMATGETGFRDDAVRALETALARSTPGDPFRVDAHKALVETLVALEDWVRAVRWGERYVEANDGDIEVWKLLAHCYRHQGNEARAEECLARTRR